MVTSELYDIVDKYLQKNITVAELEDWIVARFQLFFSLPLSPESEFVAGIELGLAEMSNSARTEEEFRSMLRKLLWQVETIIKLAKIKPFEHVDKLTGNKIAIRVSPYYNILSVNQRVFYFNGETGDFDGTSIAMEEQTIS